MRELATGLIWISLQRSIYIFTTRYTENLKKLISVGSDELGLSCVNGIKAIAMIMIIAGHALLFMIGGPVQNSGFYEKVINWDFFIFLGN